MTTPATPPVPAAPAEPSTPSTPSAPAAHTVVIGGGIGGLTAALTAARAGHRVTVFEKSATVGGIVSQHTLGGQLLDAGAESFATRSSRIPPFLDSIGLSHSIVSPNPAGAWLFSANERGTPNAAPLPKTGLLGIPGHPLAADVRRVLGWPGALRAATDRWRKPDASFDAVTLGQLLRARLGSATLDKLVRPVVGGVYTADPDTLAVDSISPSLRAELVKTGSLTRAVTSLTSQAEPGSAVRGVIGGNFEIVQAILRELHEWAADIRTGHEVTRLRRRDDGWLVDDKIHSDAVIVACHPIAAATLLAGVNSELVPFTAQPNATRIDTLMVKNPALDSAPRGTGILLGNTYGLVKAKALTHVSAKWAWLRDRLEPGVHVIRLSYREEATNVTPGVISRTNDLTVALNDASILLGTRISPAQIVDHDSITWVQWPVAPASVRSIFAKLPNYPGLGVTGSWASGTGLASVIPAAIDEANRVCDPLRSKGKVQS